MALNIQMKNASHIGYTFLPVRIGIYFRKIKVIAWSVYISYVNRKNVDILAEKLPESVEMSGSQ